jgi:hypothetical protein
VLQLGKRIVDEFSADQRPDTLAYWMAHYVAELIEAAETAADEERPAKLKQCADAIIELWKHRSEFPSGMRPFRGFEAVYKALESLDLSEEKWRYHPFARFEAEAAEEPTAVKSWFKNR